MAKKMQQTEMQGKWQANIAKAEADAKQFCKSGDEVHNRYMLESTAARQRQNSKEWRDKFNVLYSSTETIRPSLYSKSPKPEVNPRQKDQTGTDTSLVALMLENCLEYAIEDVDIDGVMSNVCLDYLLPGLGLAWVVYDVNTVKVEPDEEGAEPYEELDYERLDLEYVAYNNVLFFGGPTWADIWAIAKKLYFTKQEAVERFGVEAAAKLSYVYSQENADSQRRAKPNSTKDQAVVYEIWDKREKSVIWFSMDCPDVLEEIEDPLKLKEFFPCPKPLRAVYNTTNFMPKSFFSQYRQQAETVDDLTMRIRILGQALRLVGVYDQSQESLANLLTGTNNKMVPVENFAQFASTGGLQGSVQFLPVQEVAQTLLELYKQREIAKNEIYEITGFSDIVRGVSKASETLGAQEIKNEWAGGRLRMLQGEVQRFARDLIAIMGEIIAEQFEDETIKLFSGYQAPEVTPQEQQQIAQATAAAFSGQPVQPVQTQRSLVDAKFAQVVKVLREEKLRCARISIETDSTIQPDETKERKDRMDFLGAMGAFLQQAGPMAMQYPEMRGMLGAMMMFTARTFKQSRVIEKEFESFVQKLSQRPPEDPNGNKESGDKGQSQVATAQLRAQTDTQTAQLRAQTDTQLAQLKASTEEAKAQREHEYKMLELQVRMREVAVKEAQLRLQREDQSHDHAMDLEAGDRDDERLEIDRAAAEAQQSGDGAQNGSDGA